MDEPETDNLESIIAIINQDKTNLSFTRNYQSQRIVRNSVLDISIKNSSNGNSFIKKSKTLQFKPWSGSEGVKFNVDEIKEQIAGESEEHEEEGQKLDKQTYETVQVVVENGYYYKFQNGMVKLLRELLEENGFKNVNLPRCRLLHGMKIGQCIGAVGQSNWKFILRQTHIKKVNHFPNSFQITRKDLMNKNISKMQIKYGLGHFNFLPKTYILPLQLSQFQQQISRNKQIYIVKPHNRSQGKGIVVTDQLDVIYSRLQKYSSLVVSEYIDNPLLINGYKFDLRIYVGITSVYPLRIYIYEEGLARFATEQYNNSMSEQKKSFRHLTNYSVNKKNQNFVSSSTPNDDYFGSKWALTALKDFLEHNIGKHQANELFERIDDLVIKTILSIENLLFTNTNQYVPYVNNCFEILGFDVLIDSVLKPWLVEVNLSPSMNTDSPLDLKIKGSMVSDMFTMLGVVPHSERYTNNGHLRNLTTKHANSRGNKNQLQAFEKYVIKQMESENQRSGGWKRVFPCPNSHKYTPFFQIDRYLNAICRESIKDIRTVSNPGLQMLKYRNSIRIQAKRKSESKEPKKRPQYLIPKPSLKFRIR